MEHPKLSLVHEDSRGEMYAIKLPDGRELMLIHSVPGALRGGHSHASSEAVMVLEGEMLHRKRVGDTETMTAVGDCGVYWNLPGEIHLGEFDRDCWLVEWRKGTDRTNTDYEPWREKVRANAAR